MTRNMGLSRVMESLSIPQHQAPNTSRLPTAPLVLTLRFPCCCLTPLTGSELVQSLRSSRGKSLEQ